jgi:uncharacterized protein (DUF2126 family)/transglutaminase-like putative cysteine protease
MSIQVSIHHRTEYHFDRPVSLSAHTIRLRPAPHTRTPVHHYALKIEPQKQFLNWQQDPFGNFIARVVFPEKTTSLVIDVNLVVELVKINPFDFFVEDDARHFPFSYPDQLKKELGPFFEITESGELLTAWLKKHKAGKTPIVDFLVALNQQLQQDINYSIRMEPGVQTCEDTLEKRLGSCRDSAWLLVQILRHMGLAARFVSGYLVQLTSDVPSLDGPSGPEADFTDLHAWAEVFVPGAGWIGLDPTSGLFAGEGHIPLACTADPVSAAPVEGATDKCEVTFSYVNEVNRIFEDPRVTKPFTEEQWRDVMRLGEQVDAELMGNDVRLTTGGEPTFVSIDDMDGAQWNTQALGDDKLRMAGELFRRLWKRFSPGGVLFHGQGKWYPGEPLPRWALHCYWRRDGQPVWANPGLLVNPATPGHAGVEDAQRFAVKLATTLGLKENNLSEGYEDVLYYLWKEGTLPVNVDVLNNKLDSEIERKRMLKLFERGLDKVTGYALPLAWDTVAKKWISSEWSFRRGNMFLVPGDSPMGYRLPLDSLLWQPTKERQKVIEADPFERREALAGEIGARYTHITATEGRHDQDLQMQEPADDESRDAGDFVRTALCIEPRNGHIHIFLPPLTQLNHWVDLLHRIESVAEATGQSIVIEGYEAPRDERLRKFSITPDPGVIEVNIHPAENWPELVENTETLYEEARLSRLGTEKFMLDGRHTGTGGGNHVTLGGASPSDSPLLRKPQVLASLIRYWQNHPSLSYLFSGMFIGPTSQAPRVDEARDDKLYELEIALQNLPKGETAYPWLIDRALRNILTDMTGNTHRSEFCIDKLYSPDSATGRLGLLEFRGFEMPPHSRMALVQNLLLRTLVSRFWQQPYEQELVRWGTELHDRFMLPHYVNSDIQDVVKDLQGWGYNFDPSWLEPFIEFRFPRYGSMNVGDIEMELRFAIEPWHVLGEEVTGQGTARYVDSSVERLQLKVRGMTNSRHFVSCNGQRIPLRSTGECGEYVAGVRFKAWNPSSSLHPAIGVQAPLVFDLMDAWSQLSLGGCTYHVEHPGGLNSDVFPVNAFAAESRRLSRFWQHGHTAGKVEIPEHKANCDHPFTLDLRYQSK